MPGPLLTQFAPRAVSCFEFWLYLCCGLAYALSVLLSYTVGLLSVPSDTDMLQTPPGEATAYLYAF